jgi:hypothetical protein
VSESSHLAAVRAALDSAGAAPHDIGRVPGASGNPGQVPQWYTETSVVRRFGGNPRVDSRSSVQGYRITTRAVANSAANARNIRAKQHAALEDVALTVDGEQTTPIKFESADPIASDEGMFSGLTTWTYAH